VEFSCAVQKPLNIYTYQRDMGKRNRVSKLKGGRSDISYMWPLMEFISCMDIMKKFNQDKTRKHSLRDGMERL
jgi:hypothetical protein